MKIKFFFATFILLLGFSYANLPAAAATDEGLSLINVSYETTREFFDKYNQMFIEHWKNKTGQEIEIKQSHGSSGKQAVSVIEGAKADVVTLALSYDIDMISEKAGIIDNDWKSNFANESVPFTSLVVFMVRGGNPKRIRDWDDLIRDDIQVVVTNPKTSGGGRWNYLAAWLYASHKFVGNESKIRDYMEALFRNVPVLNSGSRGATKDFVQRGIGDVLVTFENEAMFFRKQAGENSFEIIYPSTTMKTEMPVAVINKNSDSRGTSEAANEYLKFLYSKEAQELAAQYFYRPSDPEIIKKYAGQFPSIQSSDIDEVGGWKKAHKVHFDDGGSFDQIYGKR